MNEAQGNTRQKWVETTIGRIGEVVTGRTPSTKNEAFYGGEFKLISPVDLGTKKYVTTSHKRLTETGFRQGRPLPPESVLVSCIGTIGKLGIVGDEVSTTNQQINAVICNDCFDPHFVYYSLMHNRKRLTTAASMTTMPILNKTNLQLLRLLLPPLDEQRKIAAVLSLVQQAIEQQERLIALTTELKRALMHKIFTEGLRGERQKETEAGPIPESWKVVEFEKAVTLQRGKDLTKAQQRHGKYPVIGATKVIGYHESFNVPGPGVTVVRSGSSAGKPQYVIEDLWAHNVVLYVRDFHGNDAKFMYYLLDFLDIPKYREGVAVPTLNRNTLRSLLVPLPTLVDQKSISELLTLVDSRSESASRRMTLYQDLFRTLLHQLMTGQIQVNDLDVLVLDGVVDVGDAKGRIPVTPRDGSTFPAERS